MFEGRKINKLLEKFSAVQKEQDEFQYIAELKGYGQTALRKSLEAFQHKRLTPGKAQVLLDKLCDETSLELIIPLIGDAYDEVRRIAKEMIVRRWPRSAPGPLTEYLRHPDIYCRNNAVELLIQLHDQAIEPQLISMYNTTAEVELKKNILKILSNLGGRAGKRLIINALNDNAGPVRLRALQCLAANKDPEALEPLLQKLQEHDPQVRMQAMDALRGIADQRASRPMLELLRDTDLLIRQKATDTLIEVGTATIVPELINLMRDPDVDVRRCAVEVLKHMKDPNTIDALMKAIKDSDWWVRQLATDSLTAMSGGNIANGFLGLINDDDENVRRCAVEFFVQVPTAEAFEPLLSRLADPDWWVRGKAMTALGKIGNPAAVEPLLALLDDPQVNRLVPTTLAEIGGEKTRQPLLDCLFDESPQVRLATIQAMEKHHTPSTVTDLQQCLADPDEEVRNAAIHALKALTGKIFKAIEGAESPLISRRRKIPADTSVVTEAIVVIDLCNSTDITSRYGDNFALQLMQQLAAIVNPQAKREKYRFIKGTGDGFLITFPAVENAIRFSLTTLREVNKQNDTTEESKKINLRFAINLGEARIDENGDRLGAAVSMTFRVEGVKPDGLITTDNGMTKDEMPLANRILITENVERELKGLPGIATRLVGLFELKGITGLHRIFHLHEAP